MLILFRSKKYANMSVCYADISNGGFFGASGYSVAHHEEPIVQDGRVLYNVDLLRPKDQGWFFAVNSSTSVIAGQPRFSMLPSIPWGKLGNYQTVLGGVRPLRVDGNSIPLKPGAGATTLRCSRTSVGWSADGDKFYILIVYDPDSEAASQFQRKMHWFHAGGWDVSDVQKFWEQRGCLSPFFSMEANRLNWPTDKRKVLIVISTPDTNTATPSATFSNVPYFSPCRFCHQVKAIAACSITSILTGLSRSEAVSTAPSPSERHLVSQVRKKCSSFTRRAGPVGDGW